MTIKEKLSNYNPRSCWNKGVKRYAEEILEQLEEYNLEITEKNMLNGAADWKEYSEGGCSLIMDEHIARRVCTPTEYWATSCGQKQPNKRETWLDVQARALYQAARLLIRLK